jgi:plastocyanin
MQRGLIMGGLIMARSPTEGGRPNGRLDQAAALPIVLALAVGLAPTGGAAQDVLDRTPNLSGGWVGIPWTVHTELPHRFRDTDSGGGIASTTTFAHSLGLPARTLAGVAWAMQSPTVPERPDEVQLSVRHRLLGQETAFADLAVTAAWNFAAGSADGELEAARWLGPVRLLGGVRWFTDARRTGDAAGALAAGAVWHPLPGRAGLALAGDVAVPLGREADDALAWSAGVQAGLPHTGLSMSLHLTNTAARTLQGASFAADTRYGVELAFTIPVGYVLGGYPDRAAAEAAVVEGVDAPADAVVEIRQYLFGPVRLEVAPGTVVEWVNRDAVVHTANAEDAAWVSGAIPPGGSWRARFDQPGVYPYYCGPHPYMKGVVIVR